MVELVITLKPEMINNINFEVTTRIAAKWRDADCPARSAFGNIIRATFREGIYDALKGIGIDSQSVILASSHTEPLYFKIICETESEAVRFKLEHSDHFKEIHVSA